MHSNFTYRFVTALWLCAIFLVWVAPAAAQLGDPAEFFEMRVRPLLAENCFACHTDSAMGGLQMKSREALQKGGDSGPAIVPGHPEQSLLIQAVRQTHEQLKMPPQGKLRDEEVAALVTWIRDGAVWPQATQPPVPGREGERYVITPEQRNFWAFQSLRSSSLPEVKNQGWIKSPIDRFILAALEERGLKPAQPAGRLTLIRRAYLDLIGLPPTPKEVEDFLQDLSPDAFGRVVDRLLASPQYGERWGRFWLDLARYSDDRLNSTEDEPYANAFRYRDWVIQAFNEDLPFDLFVKAQLAGDLLPEADNGRYVGGLGFYALSPQFQDDRVDATTRTFLGLTTGCAQCHDHKFDPIPTEDYYALLGVFNSTEMSEYPLSPEAVVKEYQAQEETLNAEKEALAEFRGSHRQKLVDVFAHQISRYIQAVWKIVGPSNADLKEVTHSQSLDVETLERWVKYLDNSPRDHPFLDRWDDFLGKGATPENLEQLADEVEALAISVIREKRKIDRENKIRTHGKTRLEMLRTEGLSLERDQYFLWRDLASAEKFTSPTEFESGILLYKDEKVDRFIDGLWGEHLKTLLARVERVEATMPEKYPFYHVVADLDEPANEYVRIRGNENNLGAEVPRRFLSILNEGEPKGFTRGSGRLELAKAIVDPANPLTARVMVNRIWLHHFGQGLVRTPSNFGQMGDRPSHPGLLDYLARQFIQNQWSVKAMHREMMLSATYALSAGFSASNYEVDPGNRLLWRYNSRRLDVESLRDSLLYVAGKLDLEPGGSPSRLGEEENLRRTVYGFVSRRRLDTLLSLFDFPNPNSSTPQRMMTNTPLQGLFFLNSDLVMRLSEALSSRLQREAQDEKARIRLAYRLLFGRQPTREEMQMGQEFVHNGTDLWPHYSQVLLSSNEFLYLN